MSSAPAISIDSTLPRLTAHAAKVHLAPLPAGSIVEDLQTALAHFAQIASDLKWS